MFSCKGISFRSYDLMIVLFHGQHKPKSLRIVARYFLERFPVFGRRPENLASFPTAHAFLVTRQVTSPARGTFIYGLSQFGPGHVRAATHWDDVVTALGYDYLCRHDLRHTGLTWMADAGVPVHVLRKIAGHGSLTTTQRYLHPDMRSSLMLARR